MRFGRSAGREIATVTADAGYAYAQVYGGLERRGIDPAHSRRGRDPSRSRVPLRRFRYDARNNIVKCPRGKLLRPLRVTGRGRFFHSRAGDCRALSASERVSAEDAHQQKGGAPA